MVMMRGSLVLQATIGGQTFVGGVGGDDGGGVVLVLQRSWHEGQCTPFRGCNAILLLLSDDELMYTSATTMTLTAASIMVRRVHSRWQPLLCR